MQASVEKRILNLVAYTFLCFMALLCVIPLYLIVIGSFSKEADVIRYGYKLLPSNWSLEAYKLVFKAPLVLINAYAVSISIIIVGTILGVFLTSITAYVMQRKDFKYRNYLSIFVYFTSIFNGGLVPWYIIMISYLHMKNNYMALILPLLLNVFYILIMKSFFIAIPDAIAESGKIDGASEFTIFLKLILPVAKPGLATIGIFISLGYWNDWFSAMLFITNAHLIPLQYFLYNLLNQAEAMQAVAAKSGLALPDVPKETFKLVMTVLATIPVLFVYPFAQRFIINGVTIGSVKG